MLLKFSKMHGLGNDFIVINNLINNYQFTKEQIAFLADRKFGIGCDQVLIIDNPTDSISDFYYKIYNADGSIAGQCGNGARCFIRYVHENKLTNKTEISLQTRDRIIKGKILENNQIMVDMGIPIFTPSQIPLIHTEENAYFCIINGAQVRFYSLSMGNPHAIIEVDDLTDLHNDAKLENIASYLQNSNLFPESVNVNFIYVLDKNNIQMRTYERGCGFTLACGTGACASAAAMIRENRVSESVNMFMLGGDLKISWFGNELYMQGNATYVFDGEIII
ncbi:MAG: diaminopimelate epimerase [Burkholderiales bacterium]|nr:diaminopimelate epimerase [Burkholderiales bacterium]